MLKKILLMVLLSLFVFSLCGCQTLAGLGEDITWTAESTAELLEDQ